MSFKIGVSGLAGLVALCFVSLQTVSCQTFEDKNAKLGGSSYSQHDSSPIQTAQLANLRPHDISILFPLPNSWEDDVRLLSLGWQGDGTRNSAFSFLSKAQFSKVVSAGFESLRQEGADSYKRIDRTWKLINN